MGKSRASAEGGKRGRKGAAKGQADPASFETALEQLESTVVRLEEGEMPLEEALELFESGVKLSRQCSTTLGEAERRIEILVADRGTGEDAEAVPFEPEEGDDGSQSDDDFED